MKNIENEKKRFVAMALLFCCDTQDTFQARHSDVRT